MMEGLTKDLIPLVLLGGVLSGFNSMLRKTPMQRWLSDIVIMVLGPAGFCALYGRQDVGFSMANPVAFNIVVGFLIGMASIKYDVFDILSRRFMRLVGKETPEERAKRTPNGL